MSSPGRMRSIDGLRGVAVLLVVAGHTYGSAGPYAASVGVTIFFVLSGFLITRILVSEYVKHQRLDLAAFYARRALRLYPALIAMLVGYALLLFIWGDSYLVDYLPRALLAGTYLANFAEASGNGLGSLTHTWSLAVEEQFYLIWPIVLVFILRKFSRDVRRLRQSLAALVAVALVWRILGILLLSPDRVYHAPDTSFFALSLGCLLAVTPIPTKFVRIAGPVAFLTLLGLAIMPGEGDKNLANFVTTIAALASALTVSWASTGSRLLDIGVLRWFGDISYSFYLWHLPLLNLGEGDSVPTGMMRLVALTGALVLAVASRYLLEAPILKIKRKLERGTAGDFRANDVTFKQGPG